MKNIFITGISSDIGMYLAEKFYTEEKFAVSGTYRTMNSSLEKLNEKRNMKLYCCDFSAKAETKKLIHKLNADKTEWDIFISSVGTMEPIGRFFENDFEKWERNIYLNTLSQLELLHGIAGMKRENAMVLFWAGGGTNGTFTNYSAYCISKIMLIKMCELLYDEYPEWKIVIAGPGFIKTKIHNETFKAGMRAGDNLTRTLHWFEDEGCEEKSLKNVYQFVKWAYEQKKEIVSGRNFSIVHDDWKNDEALISLLSNDENMYKLRRYGN